MLVLEDAAGVVWEENTAGWLEAAGAEQGQRKKNIYPPRVMLLHASSSSTPFFLDPGPKVQVVEF